MAAIIISEVKLIKDYVALKNNSNSAVNLKGWHIIDTTPTNQKRHEFVFKKDFFLAVDAEVKIWSGIGNEDANNIYQNRKAKIWNNPGDTATLYDTNGNEVHRLTVGKPPIQPPQGQSKVYGYVTDNVCKQPIVNAHLIFKEGQFKKTANTGEDGYYELNLPAGRYNTTITADNYEKVDSVIVGVQASSEVRKDFQMIPDLEIELGLNSTSVTFTRKDDKLVNAVRQLANKITVDINTDYTFTAKIAIKKGMTNYVKAVLAENKNNNLDSQEDNTCRISEDGKTLELTFKPIKHNWKWYKIGWFWLAEKIETEKTYMYKVELLGKYGGNKFSSQPIQIGKVVVKVNKDKLDAFDAYNILLGVEWGMAIIAIAAIIVAAIIALPALAAVAAYLGLAGATTTAAVAGIIGGSLGLALRIVDEFKQAALLAMDDPPKINRNYKTLVKSPRKVALTKQSIKNFVVLREAILTTRDRLYSAHIKEDRFTMKKQLKHIRWLLKINKTFVNKTIKHISDTAKLIQKSRLRVNRTKIAKIRRSIKTGRLTKKLMLPALKKYGFSKTQLDFWFKLAKSNRIKDKQLLPLPKLKQLSSIVLKFNDVFEADINKEIKWYSKA